MDIIFLGYNNVEFTSDNGNRISGVKFQYYFRSNKPTYVGYESAGIFVSSSRDDLIRQIRQAEPLKPYVLNMGYDGKRAVFNGLSPVK